MREYPDEITPALREVLAMMVMQTIPVAHAYRAAGHAIPNRIEDEQAFVMHKCIKWALEHGDKWREVAYAELKDILPKKGPAR